MVNILNFEQYSFLIKDFQKQNPKGFSNCFLMPEEIKQLIEQRKIYFFKQRDWLFIVCDRNDYYSLYYYSSACPCKPNFQEIHSCCCDKIILSDVVSRINSQKNDEALNMLLSCELFSEYKVYKRMILPAEKEVLSENLNSEYTFDFQYENCEDLHFLWKTALDEKSTPLPNENDVKKLENNKNMLYIVNESKSLCAVGMLNVQGKQALIEHIAVGNLHRRKGLAKYIVTKLISYGKEKGIKAFKLWVDCKNMPAIKLYDCIGFVEDGMICKQFELKG